MRSPADGPPAPARPAGEDAPGGKRWRGRPPRAVWVHLAVLAVYLAAGIAVNWTRAAYLVHHLLPKGRDLGLYVWDFWWMAHCVTHLSDPFFSRFQAAPEGVPLAFHTLMPLPGALMTPVTLIYGPSFTLNLLTALAPGVTCYAMYRVARLWLPTQAGAIAAGAFFGLSTIATSNDWNEAQLMLGQIFLPLALEAAVRLGRRRGAGKRNGNAETGGGWGQAVILGVVLGAALLTDQESAILAGVLAALALLPWLARPPARGGDPILVKLRAALLALGVFLLIGSPQLIAMYQQNKTGDVTVQQSTLAADYHNSGTTLQQMFAPSPRVASYGLKGLAHYYFTSGPVSETVVAYGWVVSAVALFGLAVCWRRHGTRPLALLWIGATLLALGTAFAVNPRIRYVPFARTWHGIQVSLLMPYTWMVRISAFSSFREANRLTELGLVAAALLAGAGVDWLFRHAALAVLVVAAAAVFEMGGIGAGANPPTAMPAGLPALDRPIAADHSPSIVVDVPFGVRSAVPEPNEGAGFNPVAQVVATEDGHPRTIGYVSRLSEAYIQRVLAHPFYRYLADLQGRYDRSFLLALFGRHNQGSLELTAARRDARRMDVGWAIIWTPERGYLRYLEAVGFRFAYQAGGAAVYRLPPAGHPGAS